MKAALEELGQGHLPELRSLLAVIAHPDDESFGLGALMSTFVDAGSSAAVLCFTHGGASTLGDVEGDLGAIRGREFTEAAAELGIAPTRLLDYPDGALESVAVDELAAHVGRMADDTGAEALLVFDEGGVTGHPDHARATTAALEAARSRRLTVLAWTISEEVARVLNAELSTDFVGRRPGEIDLRIVVDRRRQLRAIARHGTQSAHNPVLWRRLELQGDREWLRHLVHS